MQERWRRERCVTLATAACCPRTPVGLKAACTSASMRQGWTPKKGIMGKAGLGSTPGGAGRGVIMIPPVSTANSKHNTYYNTATSPHALSSPHCIPTHLSATMCPQWDIACHQPLHSTTSRHQRSVAHPLHRHTGRQTDMLAHTATALSRAPSHSSRLTAAQHPQ